MPQWIKEHKAYVLICLLLVVILVLYFIFFGREPVSPHTAEEEKWERAQPGYTNEEVKEEITEEIVEEDILVDVKGAVKNPGVYYAHSGDRVIDVIDEAGGLMDDADEAAVNFAMRVVDEMVIYIPKEGEDVELPEGILAPVQKPEGEGKINLNKADQSELETLPGIGPSKAEAIIEYRENEGPFKTIEDLMLVSGFGEKTFTKLKEKITVK